MLGHMAFRFARRRPRSAEPEVLGTYLFPSRTVRVLRMSDQRIEWTCDCEAFGRQGARGTRVWCKHIAKAAARRSLERLTRRVSAPEGAS